jgi:hypothetical protein
MSTERVDDLPSLKSFEETTSGDKPTNIQDNLKRSDTTQMLRHTP